MKKKYTTNDWFNARKAAHVAAFFIIKAGGQLNILKLTKLIYLSDRKHMERYDFPIVDDKLVSMPYGPVNSITNNLMNGCGECESWESLISARSGHNIGLVRDLNVEDLDELSDAEIETLEDVWGQFKGMGRFELANWTHDHCPEWRDPDGSAFPITYQHLFAILGKQNAADLVDEIERSRELRALLHA